MHAPRKIWDISQPLRPSLPVWPGDTAFAAAPRWSLSDESPVNVTAITLSTHSGAHADAPSHYRATGLPIDAVALEPYLGLCRVVDARGERGAVSASLVERHWSDGITRMLFRTFAKVPHERWPTDFTVMSAAAIRALGARGVVLVGIDSPSLDPEDSKTMYAHLAVPPAMRILEGLVLDHVPPGDYELIALPLPLAGLDASPVRAVLRELE
jgi:arylformamidase